MNKDTSINFNILELATSWGMGKKVSFNLLFLLTFSVSVYKISKIRSFVSHDVEITIFYTY